MKLQTVVSVAVSVLVLGGVSSLHGMCRLKTSHSVKSINRNHWGLEPCTLVRHQKQL